jgi:hypothetical protein
MLALLSGEAFNFKNVGKKNSPPPFRNVMTGPLVEMKKLY